MLKFILFTILFIYIAYKVSGFVLRIFDTLLGRTGNRTTSRQGHFGPQSRQQQYRKPPNGNVNIEYIPEEEGAKKKQFTKSFKGGEYVDYEEVTQTDEQQKP